MEPNFYRSPVATPDDITDLFNDDRAPKREAANQEARRLEEDYGLNHSVETYGDPAPEGVEVVGSEAAWQKLEDHLTEHRPLLNDLPEWRANYAEIDAERFRHIRQRGDEDRGREK